MYLYYGSESPSGLAQHQQSHDGVLEVVRAYDSGGRDDPRHPLTRHRHDRGLGRGQSQPLRGHRDRVHTLRREARDRAGSTSSRPCTSRSKRPHKRRRRSASVQRAGSCPGMSRTLRRQSGAVAATSLLAAMRAWVAFWRLARCPARRGGSKIVTASSTWSLRSSQNGACTRKVSSPRPDRAVGANTLTFSSHESDFGYQINVHYKVQGDRLSFKVVIPDPCTAKCLGATGRALSDLYPGPFERVS